MALRVMSMTDLRLEVLREASFGAETVTAICRRYGISRQSYYLYLRRFGAEGIDRLAMRSRQPIHQPRRMAEAMETAICDMRKDHPKWGARRIRTELRRQGLDPPAISSTHQALVRNNLVAPGRARAPKATQRFERGASNELWQIDATRLLLADESEVWVMDMLDDHSRFCVAARVSERATGVAALACFDWATSRYGLPNQVLSDNGLCFTGRLKNVQVAFELRLARPRCRAPPRPALSPPDLRQARAVPPHHEGVARRSSPRPASRSSKGSSTSSGRTTTKSVLTNRIDDVTPAERYDPGLTQRPRHRRRSRLPTRGDHPKGEQLRQCQLQTPHDQSRGAVESVRPPRRRDRRRGAPLLRGPTRAGPRLSTRSQVLRGRARPRDKRGRPKLEPVTLLSGTGCQA